MDRTEHLSRYLDGELDDDELAALERALGADPRLREELARLHAVQDALGSIAPTDLPDGARDRLDDVLDPVLTEVLHPVDEPNPAASLAGAPTTAEAAGDEAPVVELASRRVRSSRWLPAAGGVAAAATLLVAGLVGIRLAGDDRQESGDEVAMLAEDADVAEAPEVSSDDAGEASADEDGSSAPQLLPPPVVRDDGRDLASDELGPLLRSPELDEVLARELEREVGRQQAARSRAELDSGRVGLDPAVLRCLDELLDDGDPAIITTVELLVLDGVDAVAVSLVVPSPPDGIYDRVELWVMERASCEPLAFESR